MQKLIFILICVVFLPFSCSDVSKEEKPPSPGGFEDGSEEGTGRGKKGRDGSTTLGDKTTCKGDGYTLYLDDCPSSGEEGVYGLSSGLSDSEGAEGWSDGFSEEEREGTSKSIDILFVINTSNWGMYLDLQYKFKRKFKNFIPHLRGTDWRMLFTNATYAEGCRLCPFGPKKGEAMRIEAKYAVLNQRYLERSSLNNPTNVFLNTITTHPYARAYDNPRSMQDDRYIQHYPPYMNSKSKYPLRALQSSFSANQSLTREEADLVAVIVSNQDESAHESSTPTAESLLQEFQKVYGEEKKLYLLNIIVLVDDERCLNTKYRYNKHDSAGQQIAEVAKEIGGGNFSICLQDYSIVAKTIARLSRR